MLDRVIRVDMKNLEVYEEKLSEKYKLLSGRSLTSRLVYDEIPPHADTLGPHNKLFITCGLMAGTTVSSVNRLSVGTKSPLTGGIKESNAGGIAAYKMGRMGIRAIVLEGLREDDNWYILVIDKDGCRLENAAELKEKGIYEKAELLYQRYGKKVGVILIGPAGERLLLTAGIANNDGNGLAGRFCGRGGVGAVMGSKHLLGIVLDEAGCIMPEPVDKDFYKQKLQEYNKGILETPMTNETFPKYGTAGMMELTNAKGGLPTRNFYTGRFAGADKINGQALYDTIVKRGGEGNPTHACMPGCLVRCSNIFPDQDGNKIVSPLEYETLCLMGSNLEIDDLDVIAQLNYMCNDYGVDTIDVGCAFGVVMEAGLIKFGDKAGVLSLMEEVLKGTPLGRIMASGAAIAGKVFGVRRVPVVKGQSMAAYDPRAIKGTGITYATSPMGADHTAGNLARSPLQPHMKAELAAASRNAQIAMAVLDGLGFCMMVVASLKDRQVLADLINARFGWKLSNQDLENIGIDTLKTEKEFNRKAGFTKSHDRLPEYFYEEVNPASGTVFDITEEDLDKLVY